MCRLRVNDEIEALLTHVKNGTILIFVVIHWGGLVALNLNFSKRSLQGKTKVKMPC